MAIAWFSGPGFLSKLVDVLSRFSVHDGERLCLLDDKTMEVPAINPGPDSRFTSPTLTSITNHGQLAK